MRVSGTTAALALLTLLTSAAPSLAPLAAQTAPALPASYVSPNAGPGRFALSASGRSAPLYLWPAMWGNAFADDDTLSPRLADEYGIVTGTSHHEPLTRAQAEWRKYGRGAWSYEQNDSVLREFWRGGIQRMGSRENIVTVGMRGDGDEPMTRGTAISHHPIIAGFYPNPTIIRAGDGYYIAMSSFAYFPGVPLVHSKDVVNWTQIGNILDRPSQLNLGSAGVSRGIFALSLSYHDGTSTRPDEWKVLVAGADGTILSTKVAGGFVGTLFGMYAYSDVE